ncbi:MAG: 50S ribosomal protein L15 [Candidatus Lokiarchaeota archaeon]|nr:50S ribosomal protein L15 [Candidatus Lokiarchaeota archaeon]
MTRKFKKDSRKYRGHRTHGYGNCQGRRKAGRKGGHGLTAGWKKYKKATYLKQKSLGFPNEKYGKNRPSPWIHGKHGFKRPQKIRRIQKVNAINIGNLDAKIDKWVEEGMAEKSGSTYTVNLDKVGFQKLLARGNVNKKINVKVKRASIYAVEEIENAGGSVDVQVQNYKERS